MNRHWRSWTPPIALNLGLLAGTWLLSLAFTLALRSATDSQFSTPAAILVAAAIGAAAAWQVRALPALLVILGSGIWVGVEVASSLLFGVTVIRGREPHLTVLAAAMAGVLLGFAASHFRRESKPTRSDASSLASRPDPERLVA